MSIRKCRRCGEPRAWSYGSGIYCSEGCRINLKVCLWCGAIFISQSTGGMPPVYCDDECRALSTKEHDRLEHIKADKDKSSERYKKRLASNRKFSHTPNARKAHMQAHKKYLDTPKGHEWIERHKNTWRGKAAYMIHILQKPCVVCGETDKLLLECDHIRPRAMNGSDDLSNLQVLCLIHHAEKSAIDIKRIQAYWSKVGAAQAEGKHLNEQVIFETDSVGA